MEGLKSSKFPVSMDMDMAMVASNRFWQFLLF